MSPVFPYYSALMPLRISVFIIFMAWSMVWKGIALWKAGRNGHLAWFIIMLIVNTLGILEIIYIFAIGNKPKNKENLGVQA